jgi:hypothetical protein
VNGISSLMYGMGERKLPKRESAWKRKWTRSQRIGTFAEMAFQVALLETTELPKYQQIAEKGPCYNQPGLSHEAVARHFGAEGKTVAKALRIDIAFIEMIAQDESLKPKTVFPIHRGVWEHMYGAFARKAAAMKLPLRVTCHENKGDRWILPE